MSAATPLPGLLIVEPQFVLRRTVVAVAKSMAAAHFTEAADINVANATLRTQRFDGVVMDIDSGSPALELLDRLRRGQTACDAAVQIICLYSGAPADLDERLRPFNVHDTLRKPFKISELLASIRRR